MEDYNNNNNDNNNNNNNNYRKYTTVPLIDAVEMLDVHEVERLLSNRSTDPNERGDFRRTALHTLLADGIPKNTSNTEKFLKILNLLVDSGADVNVRDGMGDTPLFIFINVIQPADEISTVKTIIRYLLDAGADPKIKIGRETLLHFLNKNIELIKLISEKFSTSELEKILPTLGLKADQIVDVLADHAYKRRRHAIGAFLLAHREVLENNKRGNSSTRKNCPEGQVKNRVTKQCRDKKKPGRKSKKCPEGQVKNRVTKKCRDALKRGRKPKA